MTDVVAFDSPTISRVVQLPSDVGDLEGQALREGFRAIKRLRDDWEAGTNRFSAPGEALFEARAGQRLVGICGVNRDPFVGDAGVGRVRRLYVEPEARRRGIGRMLVTRVLDQAAGTFHCHRLRTNRADADQFYLALGFQRMTETASATHELALQARLD